MKKNLFLLLSGIIITSVSFSQPSATLTFTGGFSIPLGIMKGTFGETYATSKANPDSNSYFLKKGINVGISLSKSLNKKKQLRFLGGLSYNSFTQSVNYVDSGNGSGNTIDINTSMNIFSFEGGIEFRYTTRTSRINPFVSASLSANLYSGSEVTTFAIGTTQTYNLNSSIRLGLILGGGVDITLGDRLGIVVGTKYCMSNLIGKKSNGDAGKKYSLNDKAGTVNGVNYIDRNIYFIQIYTGITLYLGI